MKIIKLSYETDEGKIFELGNEEDTQAFFDSFVHPVNIQLAFAFSPNLSGGLRWKEVAKNELVDILGEAVNLIPHDIDNFFTMQCSPKCRACRLIKTWKNKAGASCE